MKDGNENESRKGEGNDGTSSKDVLYFGKKDAFILEDNTQKKKLQFSVRNSQEITVDNTTLKLEKNKSSTRKSDDGVIS